MDRVARTHDGLSLWQVVSAVLVLSCGHTHTHSLRLKDTQTDADERYTPANLVGVSRPK